MSASGIIGTFLGVRSPGTAYVCCTTTWARSTAHSARGDSRRRHRRHLQFNCDAARELGVEIKTQVAVAQILIKDGRPVGVATSSGDEYFAPVISSSVDPNLTFLKMIEPNT